MKKGYFETIWDGVHLEEEEEKEDLDIHGCTRLQQELREGNWRLGMGRQRRAERKNKITLVTERYENIKTLYINKY